MPVSSAVFRIKFCSEMFMIDICQDLIQKLLEKSGVVEDEIFWISLSVREAVINAIKHGNRFDKSKHVIFGATLRGNRLRLEVGDEGDGFVPEEVPDPLDEENLLKPSGRGIFYMRSFMDAVTIHSRPNRGTRIIMAKRVSMLQKGL